MNVTRHYSDTRTAQGRVRFLIHAGRVSLKAEGPGWHHDSTHATLDEAAIFLAAVDQVPGDLYRQALDELDRQVQFDQTYSGAA
ncbi:hypothetical protein E7T09_05260 [Deinococcus sp. KSM4-11]|uniref:hypothetical protein n=1 Tax=Deinococcus sp. KSM4-11 TaxID=2568654 RepID=UPI0010A3881B|nr:hypothetical protein [Deinococcus sp. KSM4-11]THF88602.1 hypothetical protein E7T09_05260 [Deinococcus sp. KSM4-11]